MKSAFVALGLLLGASISISCGHDYEEHHAHDAEEHPSDHGAKAEASVLDGIRLDQGKKWPMDEHTRGVFDRMATSFLAQDPQALGEDGLRQAGSGLKKDIQDLVQGCTMTGASHDQLHVYLVGYIPAVEALSQSGTANEAQTVRHYLERYGDFFE